MSLSDIKEKLYKKEGQAQSNLSGETEGMAAGEAGINQEMNSASDEWDEKKPGLSEEQKKIIKIGSIIAGSLLAVFLIFAGIYEYNQMSFKQEKVEISISGPSEGESGKALVFEIDYKNLNRAALENAELRVNYPESFKPEGNLNFKEDGLTTGVFSLGKINGKSNGKIIFSGKAHSPMGTLIYIKTDLYYTPSNFNSQFIAKNQIGVSVTSSPISLEVLAPQNVSSGDAVDYLISYKNIGREDYENIKIKAEYPGDFSFSKSNPASSEGNNVWYIGHLSAGQEGKITVSGKLNGARDDIKGVKAYIGSFDQGKFVGYNESKAETKIAASPLAISQTVNGLDKLNAKAGETLSFNIRYKNEGGTALRDIIVTEEIDSPALEYETMDLKKGAFDINTKKITWKAPDYPGLKILEPGMEETISFSIKVKDVLPVKSANDKNYVISAISKIDSPDIPTPIEMNKIIAGNRMDIKVNSKLVLDVKGFYNDSSLPNSGPIPPKVGQETTFDIHWQVTSVSNDLTGARVESVLPTGVSFTKKIFPEDARISYNDRNNSIVWDIGNISAGTGILTAPKEAIFQVKINPAPNQVGAEANLVGPSTLYAKDAFTGEDLSVTSEKKTTILPEDGGIGINYKVVK